MTLALLVVAFTYETDPEPNFHDFLVMTPDDYNALIEPDDEEVKKRAKAFRTLEEAYLYVRDNIQYAAAAPGAHPGQTIKNGYGSCLAKAALLCSLYRAMGVDEFSVRVALGIVALPEGMTEHAWLDLEIGGKCFQQDPSQLLGHFEFAQFEGQGYIDRYVVKEMMVFNDQDFGIVSQLNRMKGAMGR